MRTALPFLLLAFLSLFAGNCGKATVQPKQPPRERGLAFNDDFEQGAGNWKPVGSSEWKLADNPRGGRMYRMTGKGKYKPPHRSPRHMSLVDDVLVGDFELTVKVQSTGKKKNHRDVCIFFGYQDPSHFYYVHFGQKPDPHSCQIFIVNEEPRTKITQRETSGIPWTDGWHEIKIVRRVSDGVIEAYFDDMTTPIMTAVDKTFTWGQVGLGTFDDSGNWDAFKLSGVRVKKLQPAK